MPFKKKKNMNSRNTSNFAGRSLANTIPDILLEKDKLKKAHDKNNLKVQKESLQDQINYRKSFAPLAKIEKMSYKVKEEKMIEAWKAEEMEKVEKKKQEIRQLKIDRQEQLELREAKRVAMLKEKARYEQSLIKKFKRELRIEKEKELAKKKKQKEMFKKTMQENMVLKAAKEKEKARLAREDDMLSKEYIKRLEVQANLRNERIAKREAEQRARENKPIVYRTSVRRDEAMLKNIDKIRMEREAKAERQEREKIERARREAQENNEYVKKQIAKKKAEKSKKLLEHEHIKTYLAKVDDQVKLEKQREINAKKEKQLAYKRMLDAQIEVRNKTKKKIASQEKPFWLYANEKSPTNKK